jgi:hypothetical protein
MLKSPYKLKPLLKVLIHPRKNKNWNAIKVSWGH